MPNEDIFGMFENPSKVQFRLPDSLIVDNPNYCSFHWNYSRDLESFQVDYSQDLRKHFKNNLR